MTEQNLFGEVTVRALSWKNPFAELMLLGKIETRTWNTNYRGLVLICASQKAYSEADIIGISGELQTQRILTTLNSLAIKERNGHAIAIGNLIDCRPMRKDDEDKCFVKYNPNLFCHIYENVKPIEPIPYKGSQGWGKLPIDVLKKLFSHE